MYQGWGNENHLRILLHDGGGGVVVQKLICAKKYILLRFYYDYYILISSDVFVPDKKTKVSRVLIYLFFLKQVWIVSVSYTSGPGQVYNPPVNKHKKIYTMVTVPLTIWDSGEWRCILRYTRHYAYVGEFSLPLFINPKPNVIVPPSIQWERSKEKMHMLVSPSFSHIEGGSQGQAKSPGCQYLTQWYFLLVYVQDPSCISSILLGGRRGKKQSLPASLSGLSIKWNDMPFESPVFTG